MSLLNPFMLIGLVLAAVPIIIHFLNKTRYRVEPFGAMMFLRSAMKVRAQSLKLRQLLLLLLRALLFILLAFAFARPVQRPRSGVGGKQPTTHVLIMDGSLSMHEGEGVENAFHKARQSALRMVAEMADGDNAQIIWAGRKPSTLLAKPAFDRAVLKNHLESLEPGYQVMNVPRALQQAFWTLESSRLPRHRVVLFTDGGQHGWQLDDSDAWQQVAEHREILKIDPAVYLLSQRPGTKVPNFAVRRIFSRSPILDVFRPASFMVELANYGADRKTMNVSFAVDGEPVAERSVSLLPGVHTVQFDHLFATPGAHYVRVTLPPDSLAADDQQVFAVNVMRRIPVLIIEGTGSENPWQADGALLRMALEAPGRPGEEGLFKVTSYPQTEMDSLDTDDLNRFKTVVLANVTSLSEYFLFALERFVEQGGGLLVSVGDHSLAAEYNRMYKGGKGILPGRLVALETYKDQFFQATFPAGKAGFVLDIFDVSRTRVLDEVDVRTYWRCQPAPGAISLASFADDPFLLYKPYGSGRTMLWTTSVSQDWTNFPLTRDFLPLVQNLAIYLSASVEPPINLSPGDTLIYSTHRPVTGGDSPPVGPELSGDGSGKATPTCMLRAPDGQDHSLPLAREGDEWLAEWSGTERPGLYAVSGNGVPTRFIAVRPAPRESEQTPLLSEAVDKVSEFCPLVRVASDAGLAVEIQKETGVREWWRMLVVVALLVLTAELFLSWRFSL